MKFKAELTDTFGGEANYSWVRRFEFVAPAEISGTALMRRAKKALGMSGVRGRRAKPALEHGHRDLAEALDLQERRALVLRLDRPFDFLPRAGARDVFECGHIPET